MLSEGTRPDGQRRTERKHVPEAITSSPPEAAVMWVNAGDDAKWLDSSGSCCFNVSYVVKNAAAVGAVRWSTSRTARPNPIMLTSRRSTHSHRPDTSIDPSKASGSQETLRRLQSRLDGVQRKEHEIDR
jgi:hypothetical protein